MAKERIQRINGEWGRPEIVESKEGRLAMVIDLRRCIGCHSCSIACKQENEVPLKFYRSWVKQMEKGTYPLVSTFSLPRLCNQCEKPVCVTVCPVKATFKREDGITLIDSRVCIGCKACIAACPYDARFVNPEKGTKYFGRGTADKCTFCAHRVDGGAKPACVLACPTKARHFGDLEDPNSEVSRIIAKNPVQTIKPHLGTEPHVFYIDASSEIMGRMEMKPRLGRIEGEGEEGGQEEE